MTTFLLHDDAVHSPELRHEIGEAVPDPITFLDHGGTRIVVVPPMELSTFNRRDDVVDEVWSTHDFGSSELYGDPDWAPHEVGPEVVRRVLEKLGVDRVSVPPRFGVVAADYLRARGVEVIVDPAVWIARRRRKAPWELEGVERAQRAAETAMLTAAHLLRTAEPTNDGRLRFEGEILTAELVRHAMATELLAQGAESDEILVQSGPAALGGHELGRGPVLPDEAVVIDCFPRDRRTGVYTDMTRTLVPGRPSPRLADLHAHCRAALDVALESIRPGSNDAYAKVADYFEAHGFVTQRSHDGPGPLTTGFSHGLGHGVGLEVHERPMMGRRSDELVQGDVIAIEPGLYIEDVGGVRLEDTVLVTEGGAMHFTDPFPYDLQP
jgi:Xaa-Pro aminopeptidase